ncbi:hypothetical protein TNCV_4681111 [Trichonephila clavipes]|nr:hypothetical protein TNCV_4681111 [Trichonephila clavipes]
MRKKPKTGEGRGNKRRQSQPGRDVGGAKHETGRNGQNDKRHGRERTEAGAAKEGNKESEQNKINEPIMPHLIKCSFDIEKDPYSEKLISVPFINYVCDSNQLEQSKPANSEASSGIASAPKLNSVGMTVGALSPFGL